MSSDGPDAGGVHVAAAGWITLSRSPLIWKLNLYRYTRVSKYQAFIRVCSLNRTNIITGVAGTPVRYVSPSLRCDQPKRPKRAQKGYLRATSSYTRLFFYGLFFGD